jgi:hypothetical protein
LRLKLHKVGLSVVLVDILAKAGEVDSKPAQAIAKYIAETKAGAEPVIA